MGGGAERMTPVRPEVECRRVSHDLHFFKRRSVRFGSWSTTPSDFSPQTHPVVPNRDGIFLPTEAHLEVWVLADLVEQELEDRVGFSLGYPDDAAGEARIDIDALPARHGMDADERVYGFDLVTADVQPSGPGALSLGGGAVDRREALEVGLHALAQG